MTLSKLAQLANVSVSVVSKAFSGREDISDAMREHVFAVARQNGCFQQFYHAPYDKPVVAVIIPEAISQFYIHYIEILKKSMEKNGYTMLLSISNFDRQLTDELVRYYTMHGKVDGLILISAANRLPSSSTAAIISLNVECESNIGACIVRDLKSGIASALQYLKENGHTRVAYVGEALTASKIELLTEEMHELDLELRREWIITSRLRFEEAGRDGVRRLLELSEKPTAIIGAYGYITQGILAELSELGIRVPQDMSVLSLDNDPFPLSSCLDVACVPSGIEKMCDMAMRLLGERIGSSHPNEPCRIALPTAFYVGNTVKCLN